MPRWVARIKLLGFLLGATETFSRQQDDGWLSGRSQRKRETLLVLFLIPSPLYSLVHTIPLQLIFTASGSSGWWKKNMSICLCPLFAFSWVFSLEPRVKREGRLSRKKNRASVKLQSHTINSNNISNKNEMKLAMHDACAPQHTLKQRARHWCAVKSSSSTIGSCK